MAIGNQNGRNFTCFARKPGISKLKFRFPAREAKAALTKLGRNYLSDFLSASF
jgi:hypothetical protein